jgi:hypothetical protein
MKSALLITVLIDGQKEQEDTLENEGCMTD